MATEQNEKTLRKLHNTSMQILETLGVKLDHPKTLEIASNNGIKVSEGKVFFTEAQLMEWCSYAPSEFTIYARNQDNNMIIGGDNTEHISYNAGFPFVVILKAYDETQPLKIISTSSNWSTRRHFST